MPKVVKESKSEQVLRLLMSYRDKDEDLGLHHLLRALDTIPNHNVNFQRNWLVTRKGYKINGIYYRNDRKFFQQDIVFFDFFWTVLIGECYSTK